MNRTNYTRPRGYAFDGEPRLILAEDGVEIEVHGGQPVMDAGLENAALISLFTRRGWWGNAFLDGDYQVGDSDFIATSSGSITKTTFVESESEAKRALQWMIDDGIASEIRATVANRAGLGVDLLVEIVAPSGTIEQVNLRRSGANWVRQIEDPASARLSEVIQ
jgi:phage gp46-like protein